MEEKKRNEAVAFATFIVSFIIFTSIALTSQILDSEKYVFKEKVNIESLETSNITSGHFIMGFGNVCNKTMYYVYVKNKDGSYSLQKYPTDNSTIYEINDGEQPYVNIYQNKTETNLKYKIYVPKGAIRKEYNTNGNRLRKGEIR